MTSSNDSMWTNFVEPESLGTFCATRVQGPIAVAFLSWIVDSLKDHPEVVAAQYELKLVWLMWHSGSYPCIEIRGTGEPRLSESEALVGRLMENLIQEQSVLDFMTYLDRNRRDWVEAYQDLKDDSRRDVPIECWEHTSYALGVKAPYLCLRASREACEMFRIALLALKREGSPARRTLRLAPFDRPNSCMTIRLRLSPASDDLRQMSLTREKDVAQLEFSLDGLQRFLETVAKWRDGLEDFGVRPEGRELGSRDRASGEIWFWREQSA